MGRFSARATSLDGVGYENSIMRPNILVDEPTEEISPFDVGHAVGLFDGSETLGYLKLQASMRTSPVVVLHGERSATCSLGWAHARRVPR
jgi:hypothetical protein